jgi:hypothetical protein
LNDLREFLSALFSGKPNAGAPRAISWRSGLGDKTTLHRAAEEPEDGAGQKKAPDCYDLNYRRSWGLWSDGIREPAAAYGDGGCRNRNRGIRLMLDDDDEKQERLLRQLQADMARNILPVRQLKGRGLEWNYFNKYKRSQKTSFCGA